MIHAEDDKFPSISAGKFLIDYTFSKYLRTQSTALVVMYSPCECHNTWACSQISQSWCIFVSTMQRSLWCQSSEIMCMALFCLEHGHLSQLKTLAAWNYPYFWSSILTSVQIKYLWGHESIRASDMMREIHIVNLATPILQTSEMGLPTKLQWLEK